MISMIVACATNRAIGKDNKMLWHIPEDFKYFKKTTMGKPLIMGRKTFESIGRPLPGRQNIIISRDKNWNHEGCDLANSLEDAISLAQSSEQDEVFIAGGGQIYEQALGQADRLYITEVHGNYEADAFFPAWSMDNWKETSREKHEAVEGKPAYSFVVFDRLVKP